MATSASKFAKSGVFRAFSQKLPILVAVPLHGRGFGNGCQEDLMDKATRILYLEDDANEAELIRKALAENIHASTLDVVATRENYLSAIQRGEVDIILSDSLVPVFDGLSTKQTTQKQCPDVPFICVSSYVGRAG